MPIFTFWFIAMKKESWSLRTLGRGARGKIGSVRSGCISEIKISPSLRLMGRCLRCSLFIAPVGKKWRWKLKTRAGNYAGTAWFHVKCVFVVNCQMADYYRGYNKNGAKIVLFEIFNYRSFTQFSLNFRLGCVLSFRIYGSFLGDR